VIKLDAKIYLKRFLEELKLRGLSKDTIEAYGYANSKFLEFIKKEPKYVTRRDIKNYLHYLIDKNNKPKTVNLSIAAMKSFYDEFMGRRLFSRIRRVKPEKRMPVVLSKQEIKKMIEVISNEKHRLIIKFLYSTGVRAGELIKVRVADVDLENGFVRILQGKGKKDRLTTVSIELCNEIKEYLKDKEQEFLFESNRRGHPTVRSVEETVKKASTLAGIKRSIFPHVFRASFATHLYEDGTQLQKIQKLMGHQSPRTTFEYAKTANVNIIDVENPLDKLKMID